MTKDYDVRILTDGDKCSEYCSQWYKTPSFCVLFAKPILGGIRCSTCAAYTEIADRLTQDAPHAKEMPTRDIEALLNMFSQHSKA